MSIELKNHELVAGAALKFIKYEERPLLDPKGNKVEGLHNVWIWLNNPNELNSYTTEALKELVVAFRRASVDRGAVAVIFSGVGERAFCSGGNTREYSEYYAGRPTEYRQYMRIFNDAVTSILYCDKPTICRVNGLRVAGGQELGMACDFTVASDLAVFGQAGPRHGSAPDGGATDFLPLFVGIERAMESCALCELWSAHKAYRLGLIQDVVPVLKVDGKFVPNPKVVTDKLVDDFGKPCHGELKTGDARAAGDALVKKGAVDFTLLDQAVEKMAWRFANLMPDCTTKTLESMRKHKLEHWDMNKETNRAWLALNMLHEAKAGFQAFEKGPKDNREVDFLALRRAVARGELWSESLISELQPKARK